MPRIVMLVLACVLLFPVTAPAQDDLQVRTFKYFLKKANEGDANAQFIVGKRYERGVGTAQDLDQAQVWYTKAAQQGHDVAKSKLAKSGAPLPAAKPEVSAPVAKPKPKAAPKPAAVASTPSQPPARPSGRSLNANAMDMVINSEWARGRQDAEYLPSGNTDCVQAGASEVVCFSRELNRIVGNSLVTYTVKSTLSGFNNRGGFNVKYMYNVTDISKSKGGPKSQDNDLLAKTGWQTPGKTLSCTAQSGSKLNCRNGNKQVLSFNKK